VPPAQYWPGIQASHDSPAVPGAQPSSTLPSNPGPPSRSRVAGSPSASVILLLSKLVMLLQALLPKQININNRDGAFGRLIACLDRPYGGRASRATGKENGNPGPTGLECLRGWGAA